jgi:hypothetical protein
MRTGRSGKRGGPSPPLTRGAGLQAPGRSPTTIKLYFEIKTRVYLYQSSVNRQRSYPRKKRPTSRSSTATMTSSSTIWEANAW